MVFSGEPVGALEQRSYAAGITEREWKYLGAFAACFFTNMGKSVESTLAKHNMIIGVET
jgi:hypothetical protein